MQIYCLTNTVNGKQYVGQTTYTAETRFKGHLTGSNTFISRAIKKHGKGSFRLEVLLECVDLSSLNLAEQFFIAKLNTLVPVGYNLDSGGRNKRLHPETRKKISLARKQTTVVPWDCQIIKRVGGFRLRIKTENSRLSLGTYPTFKKAYRAYKKYKRGKAINVAQPQINFISKTKQYRLRTPGSYPRTNLGIFESKKDAYAHFWKRAV